MLRILTHSPTEITDWSGKSNHIMKTLINETSKLSICRAVTLGFCPAVIRKVTASSNLQWILYFGAKSALYMQRLCRDTVGQVAAHCNLQWMLDVGAESPLYAVRLGLPGGRDPSPKRETNSLRCFGVALPFAFARAMTTAVLQWLITRHSEAIVKRQRFRTRQARCIFNMH